MSGYCELCDQGYQLQNGAKDCKLEEEKLVLEGVNFDSLKTTIEAKFDANIKLKGTKNILVMMTMEEGSIVKVNVASVKSSRQEMILKLDLKESDEFKDKTISVKNQKFIILIENMEDNFKNKKPLPSSDVIRKSSSEQVYFAGYPIEATSIDIYIPKSESKGPALGMKVAANVAKPATAVLMIVAMPAAITLEKVL